MNQDRQIVIFLGGALAIAVILRLILGPTLVAGTGDIYAVARGPDAMAAAVALANAGDKPLFPN
jgi:hypothetical protein